MTELLAKSPCSGLLPLTIGGVVLREADPGQVTALLRRKGRDADAALRGAHGLGWPAPGRCATAGSAAVLWAGRNRALLLGPSPDPALGADMALSEQSDAWAAVDVAGADAVAVLARLVPVDLRPGVFGEGAVAHTLCGHISVSILRLGPDLFRIFAFRSMARSLVHDLTEAAESVAGRAGLA